MRYHRRTGRATSKPPSPVGGGAEAQLFLAIPPGAAYDIADRLMSGRPARTPGEAFMKRWHYLSLAVPALLVALMPAALAADEKTEESDYYPLKLNSVWHYKVGDQKFRMKAVKSEDIGGKPTVRVEMLGEG